MQFTIHPIHQRLAELFLIQQGNVRKLTMEEEKELFQCMRANADLCFKVATLKNLSSIAYDANDMEWVQEICAKLDELNVI